MTNNRSEKNILYVNLIFRLLYGIGILANEKSYDPRCKHMHI